MKFEVKNRDVLTADDELSSDISWRIVNALKQFVAALRDMSDMAEARFQVNE